MTSLLSVLLFAAVALGGGVLTFIFLHIFVPLIVRAIGEEKFVEMSGLEPVGIILFSGIAGSFLHTFASQRWGALVGLLLFPTLSILCVLYAVLWLKLAALGQGKKEFQIRNGQIVRLRDDKILAPTYVRQDADFRQTDAFHSYHFYKLTLCDNDKQLASNGYLNEEKTKATLREILECSGDTPCRALDLIFVRPKDEMLWLKVELDQELAILLCGPLEEIPEENRQWWRQWLRPQFAEDGFSEIPHSELDSQLQVLKEAYPSLIPDYENSEIMIEELEAQMALLNPEKNRKEFWALYLECDKVRRNSWTLLETLLRHNNMPIQLMTEQRFEAEVKKIAPQGAMLCYGEGAKHERLLLMKIEPR